MAFEIERKFLVTDHSYIDSAESKQSYQQAYISDDKNATVRVRIIDGCKGYLTIKGCNHGSVRKEWEYSISARDALDMISSLPVSNLINKTRYRIGRWEVDEFHGRLEGLIVAEIELSSPDEPIGNMPLWIGKEVTGDNRFYNSSLAKSDNKTISTLLSEISK